MASPATLSRRSLGLQLTLLALGASTQGTTVGCKSYPATVKGTTLPPPSTTAGRPLNVVCVGGHPDDPEESCGGTLARYVEVGHRVTIVYLTRGEAGIAGKSHAEAAAIRTAEAEEACRILGARPVFAGQINGETELSRPRIEAMATILRAEAPDIVFTHWPLDTNLDHQIASIVTIQALRTIESSAAVFFFETELGRQTQAFHPTDYVDITATREKKVAALFAHRSQDPERIYREHHRLMEDLRGREASSREVRVEAAEAFCRYRQRNAIGSGLPGL